MPIMEIKILPLGTKTPSVSDHIARSVKILNEKRFKHQLTAMGTIVEGPSVKELLTLASQMHQAVLKGGAQRVITLIELDERTDQPLTMNGKMNSLKKKMCK